MLRKSTAAQDIKHQFNGFLIDEDPAELAKTLNELSGNKELLREVGINAAGTLTKSWEKIVEEVCGRYDLLTK